MSRVLITGGCGFVGSALVPSLLAAGHTVTVLDLMLFGNHLGTDPNLTVVPGDIRQLPKFIREQTFDAVVHLACIANDPSWELDPALGKSVNYDALPPLLAWAKDRGVSRFVYASSSSVYGTKADGVEVTEDLALEPLTDYSKYKALGEDVVFASGIPSVVLRPATVCGYSRRLRLDVVVNQMTIDALVSQRIAVHGGGLQRRANLHIADMVRAYRAVLDAPIEKVAGQVFNVGAENLTIKEIAERVQAQVPSDLDISAPTNDPRSYTLNSDKLARELGYQPQYTVAGAIGEVVRAHEAGLIPDPRAAHYYNLKQMQLCHIS
jgi:nucleoside-diphosphate-sugar epimerase